MLLPLKLLEGQLINYNKGDQQFRFLNSQTIPTFSELFILFHRVLAVDVIGRSPAIQQKYSRVPYLNSSLFEISDLEDVTIKINAIDSSDTLDFIGSTILKEHKKKNEQLKTIDYLFQFLDAYDFASEDTGDTKEDNKTLINASVLGKVFEKINGYKDGSIYTPGFITMYMSRQSLRLAVLQKFNDANKWDCKEFDKLKERIEYQQPEARNHANSIINDLKICDPAVGSGHFLVSALNEIIAIKSELNILQDIHGIRLKAYSIDIINDELSVFDEDNDAFTYNPKSQQSQLVQQTLFSEKQTLIENCLFGVDINPNSVKICRLRLWIELLKNAYYKPDGNLETLPNIDINIKCGNSLISRFKLKDDEFKNVPNFKRRIAEYTKWVNDYKNVKDREKKRYLSDNIKLFNSEFKKRDPQIVNKESRLAKLLTIFNDKYIVEHLFKKDENSSNHKEKESLKQEIEILKGEIDQLKSNEVYKNAFEWRFEFPEVLDNNGDYEGFDIIIGNPPYGVSLKGKLRDAIVNALNKVPDFEIYYFFINLAKKLLKPYGIKTYIVPNTILFNVFAKNYRENLFDEWQINEILDCTNFNIFEGSATVRCIITLFTNGKSNDLVFYRPTAEAYSFDELVGRTLSITNKKTLIANNQNWALIFKLPANIIALVTKIRANKKPLIEYFPEISQGLIAYDQYQGQDKETIKNRIYHSNKFQEGWKKWLWGEDINPFIVKWNSSEYFNYVEGVANRREPKFFFNDRILIREITNPQIYAGFTSEEFYHDPALIVVLKNYVGSVDIKVLLAIINSRLATFYHFNSSPKATKGAFPKILVEDIKKFPIPFIHLKNQELLIKMVNEIINKKQVGGDTSELEQQINAIVYQLYDLTPDEIAIVENTGHEIGSKGEITIIN